MPAQQSAADAQTSPGWPQYEAAAHLPCLHEREQQSELCVHVLPRVRHDALSGVHVPFAPQRPPQQSGSALHGSPSEAQAHVFPVHAQLQHSLDAEQGMLGSWHVEPESPVVSVTTTSVSEEGESESVPSTLASREPPPDDPHPRIQQAARPKPRRPLTMSRFYAARGAHARA